MPIGALISAGTSLIGGLFGKHSANNAAQAQIDARNNAARNITQAGSTAAQGVTDATKAGQGNIIGSLSGLDPYTWLGEQAVGGAYGLTSQAPAQFSFDPSKIGQDPGYQFRVDQATKQMKQDAAAGGSLYSGGFEKALSDYISNQASSEVNNQYNRQLSTFNANQDANNNRISQLMQEMGLGFNGAQTRVAANENAAGLGVTGANAAGGFNTNAETQAGQLQVGAGDAQAVNQANQNNANQGIIGSLGNLATQIDWKKLFGMGQQQPAMA